MLEVTRLNGAIYFINPDMLLTVEATPDTVITLTNGEKLLVRETPAQLVERFTNFKRKIHAGFEVKTSSQAE